MRFSFGFKAVVASGVVSVVSFGAEPKDDRKFVEEAAGGGMAEVKLSQLALEKSTNPAVKELAQNMVTEHSKANDELKALATTKSVPVTAELPKAAQKKYDDLSKLAEAKFDKEYVAALVDDHKKTVKLFEKEAKSGDDSELKAWADKTLPTLKHHLAMVETLEKDVKARK